MLRSGGNRKERFGREASPMTISRENFINSALATPGSAELGQPVEVRGEKVPTSLADVFPRELSFRFAKHDKIAAYWSSGCLQTLFMLHAPISARVFAYFDCDQLGKRRFLRVDYQLECGESKWNSFLPIALFILITFNISLLSFTIGYMFTNRHKLQSPAFRERMGFLMAPFRHGAEWWEIQEMVRKMILAGLLIYVTPSLRVAAALLVSIIALMLLGYYQPHVNRTVFWVTALAYFLTAVKYLAITFRGSGNCSAITVEEGQWMGGFFIALDVILYTCILLSAIAVIKLARKQDSKGVVGVHRMQNRPPRRRLSITPSRAKMAVTRNTADRIQLSADDARTKHRTTTIQRKARAKERLAERLRRQKSEKKKVNDAEEKKKVNDAEEKKKVEPDAAAEKKKDPAGEKKVKRPSAVRTLGEFRVDFSKMNSTMEKFQNVPTDQVLPKSILRKIFKKSSVPEDTISALIESIAFSAGLKEGAPITVRVLSEWIEKQDMKHNTVILIM
jgi:hypothetical protein